MTNKYPEPYFSASSRTGKTISPSEEENEKRREEMQRKLYEMPLISDEQIQEALVELEEWLKMSDTKGGLS